MRRWKNNQSYPSYYNVSGTITNDDYMGNTNNSTSLQQQQQQHSQYQYQQQHVLKCTDLPQYDACMAQADMFQNDDKLHLRNLCNDAARCGSLLAIHTPSSKFSFTNSFQRRSITSTNNNNSSTGAGAFAPRRPVNDHRILLDYSRQRVTGETMEQLFDLADAVGLKDRTEAMYCGKRINTTDDQCVLHHVLRMPAYYDYDVTTEVPTHPILSNNNAINSSMGDRMISSSSARAVSDASASSTTASSSSNGNNNNTTNNNAIGMNINTITSNTSTITKSTAATTATTMTTYSDSVGDAGATSSHSKDDVLNNSATDGQLLGSTIIEAVIAEEERYRGSVTASGSTFAYPSASLISSSSTNPLAYSMSSHVSSINSITSPLSTDNNDNNNNHNQLLASLSVSPSSLSPSKTTTIPRPSPVMNQSVSVSSTTSSAQTMTPSGANIATPTTTASATTNNTRQQSRSNDMLSGHAILQQVQKSRRKVQEFVYQVRNGEYTSIIDNDTTLTNFLIVGTGGCILGTKAVAAALAATVDGADAAGSYRQLRFVSNVDPVDIYTQTKDWKASKTLVVVISMQLNPGDPVLLLARTIQTWLVNDIQFQLSNTSYSSAGSGSNHSGIKDSYGTITAKDIIGRHMIVITQNPGRCQVTLPHIETIFSVPTWVNHRFSLFSPVGLIPLSLQYSYNIAQEVMEGAHDMDEHFFQTPLRDNLPVILGLLGVWNSTFLGCSCRATIPFSQALSQFPNYLQHIDMESNGKRVAIDGSALLHRSGEIAFGDCATSCIHSFFQLLHQGRVVPVDFIGFMESPRPIDLPGETLSNHDELMSHFFAQADALAYGKTLVDLIQEGTPEPQREHSVFTGNRQSTIVLMTRLDAFSIGQLVAMYEHRSAVQGFIWGINSFDSYGHELGWNISRNVKSQLVTSRKTGASVQGFNGSTSTLLEQYLAHGRQQEQLRQQQQQDEQQQQNSSGNKNPYGL